MNISTPIKLRAWMNHPSHHQSALYDALDARDDIDLKVCYFTAHCEKRSAEGWGGGSYDFKPYETTCEKANTIEEVVASMPDWEQGIHITSISFNADLPRFLSDRGVNWCHWSEMPGIRLAEKLNYNLALFRPLYPLMLSRKRADGALIQEHAAGAFAQGELARRALRAMGVAEDKTADLFYALAPLKPSEPVQKITDFARGRKVFLSIAALCPRKGIDTLLKAFARVKADDWCLVLCGLDKADGCYQHRAASLGIGDQVFFMGTHPSEKVAEVYAASDVFILASRFDGWGAVLNEAASLGLPIISTDLTGAAWHVLEDGHTGWRVKAGSISGLQAAMSRYVASDAVRKEHGVAARKRFERLFTPEQNAERLVTALKKWGVA